MEDFSNQVKDETNDVKDEYYKPDFSILFNKIKEIKTPVKSDILIALLDGQYHSQTDLIRMAKKQNYQYMGAVTLVTMINSLNQMIKSNYVEKQCVDGEMYYKLSDNYVGLTRACFNKYTFKVD